MARARDDFYSALKSDPFNTNNDSAWDDNMATPPAVLPHNQLPNASAQTATAHAYNMDDSTAHAESDAAVAHPYNMDEATAHAEPEAPKTVTDPEETITVRAKRSRWGAAKLGRMRAAQSTDKDNSYSY